MDRAKILSIISGTKLCPQYNGCERKYCEKEKLFDIKDTRFDYVEMTMKTHNLSYEDLERLLIAYKRHFKKHEECEEHLIGKIQKIYELFELENNKYNLVYKDTCPIV